MSFVFDYPEVPTTRVATQSESPLASLAVGQALFFECGEEAPKTVHNRILGKVTKYRKSNPGTAFKVRKLVTAPAGAPKAVLDAVTFPAIGVWRVEAPVVEESAPELANAA